MIQDAVAAQTKIDSAQKRAHFCTNKNMRNKKVPNLGFTKIGAALVGLSALVLQVLGGDTGDTTLQDRRDTETSAADLRGGEAEGEVDEEER